jgi:hypothetical protein
MSENPVVEVTFRAERLRFGTIITAVFPRLPASCIDPDLMTCYAHIGQHGSCCRNWMRRTRRATDAEAASLKAELERIGYRLKVVKRISGWGPKMENA